MARRDSQYSLALELSSMSAAESLIWMPARYRATVGADRRRRREVLVLERDRLGRLLEVVKVAVGDRRGAVRVVVQVYCGLNAIEHEQLLAADGEYGGAGDDQSQAPFCTRRPSFTPPVTDRHFDGRPAAEQQPKKTKLAKLFVCQSCETLVGSRLRVRLHLTDAIAS